MRDRGEVGVDEDTKWRMASTLSVRSHDSTLVEVPRHQRFSTAPRGDVQVLAAEVCARSLAHASSTTVLRAAGRKYKNVLRGK